MIVAYNTGVLTGITIYFSALSGYLIVGYMIGDNLTVMQSAIITIRFIVFQSLISFGTLGMGTRAVFLIGKTSEEYRSGIMINDFVILVLFLLLLGGVVAALKFMWDIRHRNHEAK